MKEIWSKQYLDHISFITYPFGLFLGSFESPRVSAGIPVTIPKICRVRQEPQNNSLRDRIVLGMVVVMTMSMSMQVRA
jgi:hypothetical protein